MMTLIQQGIITSCFFHSLFHDCCASSPGITDFPGGRLLSRRSVSFPKAPWACWARRLCALKHQSQQGAVWWYTHRYINTFANHIVTADQSIFSIWPTVYVSTLLTLQSQNSSRWWKTASNEPPNSNEKLFFELCSISIHFLMEYPSQRVFLLKSSDSEPKQGWRTLVSGALQVWPLLHCCARCTHPPSALLLNKWSLLMTARGDYRLQRPVMGCYGPVLALRPGYLSALVFRASSLHPGFFSSLLFFLNSYQNGILLFQTFPLQGEQVFAKSSVGLVKGSLLSALVNPSALIWIS